MSWPSRPEQLDIDQVRALSPEETHKARKAGQLDDLLGLPNRFTQPPPLDPDEIEKAAANGTLDELLERHRNWQPTTRERLRTMSAEEIVRAHKAGELDDYIEGREK